ncbi:MAG: type VI secretion system protein ImpL [Myxococcota bacterium]|jgi:type VI secretion system protein ImpL
MKTLLKLGKRYFRKAFGKLASIIMLVGGLIMPKAVDSLRKRRAAKQAAETQPVSPVGEITPKTALKPKEIGPAVRLAAGEIEDNTAAADALYAVPWYLMMGFEAAGTSTLLEYLAARGAKRSPELTRIGRTAGCEWAFMSGGNLVAAAGEYASEASKTGGFGRILKALRKRRPDRPIDGVVLVVRADELAVRGPDAEEYIRARTEQLRDRLVRLQQVLGLQCPVHVVVSRCDRLHGFKAFVRELPERYVSDILGWSNPHALDTAFRKTWINAAYSEVDSSVFQVQASLLAADRGVEDGAAFVQFRDAIRTTRPGLEALLSGVFSPSVHLDPFFLRGIYFVGGTGFEAPILEDAGDPDAENAPPAPWTYTPGNMYFAEGLFDRKILPEGGLTRLAPKAVAIRQRAVRTIQLALLIMGATLVTGMLVAGASVREAGGKLQPVLQTVRDAGHQREAGRAPGLDGRLRSDATRLLREIAALDYGQLQTPWLPTSLWSDVDGRLQYAVTAGYARLVLPAIVAEMETAVVEAIRTPPRHLKDHGTIQDFEHTAAFAELLQRVTALQTVSGWAARYSGLLGARKRSLGDFGSLVHDVLGEPLPDQYFVHAKFHESALQAAEGAPFQLDTPENQEAARKMAITLARLMYASAFDASSLVDKLTIMESALDRLPTLSDDVSQQQNTRAYLGELEGFIREAENTTRSSRQPILTSYSFQPGQALSQMLDVVRSLSVFPPGVDDIVLGLGKNQFHASLKRLYGRMRADFSDLSDVDGPPLSLLEERAWASRFHIAPPVIALKRAIGSLLKRPFMAPHLNNLELPTDSEWKARDVDWNVGALEVARTLVQSYVAVKRNGFHGVGDGESRKLLLVASKMVASSATAAVASAFGAGEANPGSEESRKCSSFTDKELANFRRALPVLDGLIADLTDAGLDAGDAVGRRLREIAVHQAEQLLCWLSYKLDEDRPYQPDVEIRLVWDGQKPLGFLLFGALTETELAVDMEQSRATVGRLAESALPLLLFLNDRGGGADTPPQKRFKGIVRALGNQKAKKTNSVDPLEAMVLHGLKDLRIANCLEARKARTELHGTTDYFRDAHESIVRLVDRQCLAVTARKALQAYEPLRGQFARMSEQFPFCDDCADDVDPMELYEWLAGLEAFEEKHWKGAKDDREIGWNRNNIENFLESVGVLRRFFSTTLTAEGQIASLGFDVTAAFRVNKEHEENAHHVIEWQFRVNRQVLDLRTPDGQKLRWGQDDVVTVLFRWAANAPGRPAGATLLAEGGALLAENVQVSNRTVTYSFRGRWALLRLLRQHRAPAWRLKDGRDRNPTTLAFNIITEPVASEAGPSAGGATLFVRSVLYSPKNKARLSVPHFPVAMPPLGLAEALRE